MMKRRFTKRRFSGFKRKGRQGIWLPPSLQNRIADGNPNAGPQDLTLPNDNAVGVYQLVLPQISWGTTSGVELPLVGDVKPNQVVGFNGTTLNDYSFGYALKRVVGNIFVSVEQQLWDQGGNLPYDYFITAGIMVKRVTDGGNPVQPTPPQAYDNATDPWLWRRNWMLCNQVQAQAQGAYLPFPSNNCAFGSAEEGAFVDQKTRRTIKQEERLFLVVQATLALPVESGINQEATFLGIAWDLRFFGRVFASSGNRGNAAR